MLACATGPRGHTGAHSAPLPRSSSRWCSSAALSDVDRTRSVPSSAWRRGRSRDPAPSPGALPARVRPADRREPPGQLDRCPSRRTRSPRRLIHIDVKKLGKIPDGGGWRALGQGRDTTSAATRQSATTTSTQRSMTTHGSPTPRSCPTSRAPPAQGSCLRAGEFFAGHGIAVSQVISDNATNYIRYRGFRAGVTGTGAAHLTIRPLCRWQSGKVEWLRPDRAGRIGVPPGLPHQRRARRRTGTVAGGCNNRRRHSAIGGLPPIGRLS